MAALNNGGEFIFNFPPGYRFHPHDHELITYYLKPKIDNQLLPLNLMHEVFIYDHDPDDLAASYQAQGEKSWYFITKREKRDPKGKRPRRSTSTGYWRANGKKITVLNKQGEAVGLKRSLAFFVGENSNGINTFWTMQEYWIEENETIETHDQKARKPSMVGSKSDDKELDGWVLCKIYKTKGEYRHASVVDVQEKQQQQREVENIPLVDPNHASISYTQTTNYNNNIILPHDHSYQLLSSQSYKTVFLNQEDYQSQVEEIPVEKTTNHNNNITPEYHDPQRSHDNFDQQISPSTTPISITNDQTVDMRFQLPPMHDDDQFALFNPQWEDWKHVSQFSTPGISSWGCFDELSAVIDMKK